MNHSETSAPYRYLYYAFGGGMGHLNRTLSLVRQTSRHGGQHLVVTNCPHYRCFAKPISELVCPDENVRIDDLSSFDSGDDIAHLLAATFSDFLPNVFVVDTFPRGIVGELAAILPQLGFCRKALVSRTLPEEYVREYGLVDFVEQHYDLILSTNAASPFHELANHCEVDPFLIYSADEICALARSAKQDDRPKVLFVASGNELEISRAKDLLKLAIADPRLQQVQFSIATPDSKPDSSMFGWPLMGRLKEFDLVVGWAGYNLFEETRALRVPSLLMAGDRKYDDQSQRTEVAELSNEQVIDEVVARVSEARSKSPKPEFINGAEAAAMLLAHLVEA